MPKLYVNPGVFATGVVYIFDSYLHAGGLLRICICEFLFVCGHRHVIFVFVFDLLYLVCEAINLDYASKKIEIAG